MAEFRYVEYPDAKVFDDDENQINHLLFGDWVRIEGPAEEGWLPVHVRGTDGWMRPENLREGRVLEVVFTDVGQGDGCLLVTPGDKHIVIDAGASDNMYRYLKWRYAGFKQKWTFEAAVLTHPDLDHYEGFRKLFQEENVHFKTVYHNGIMEQLGAAANALGPKKKIDGRWFLTGLIRSQDELVAKACHHGAADFLDAFLKALDASVTVISSGDEESHAHPRPDTLGAVGLHGRGWRPLVFSTELMRSTREDEGSIPIEIGRCRQKLETETDPEKRKEIQAEHDRLVDKLLERNVTVYGSINLRTDGDHTIMAYKLEKERKSGKSLIKWDIYPLTRSGQGPISYRPEDIAP